MITLARMLSISRRFHRQHYHLQRSSLQCYSSAIMSTPMKATIKVDVVSDTVCPWWVPAAWLENGCVVCIVSMWCSQGAHELAHVSVGIGGHPRTACLGVTALHCGMMPTLITVRVVELPSSWLHACLYLQRDRDHYSSFFSEICLPHPEITSHTLRLPSTP